MPETNAPLQMGQEKVMDECWREKEVTDLGAQSGVVLEGETEGKQMGTSKKAVIGAYL